MSTILTTLDEAEDFVGVGRAMTLTGFGYGKINRLALLGELETRLEPGRKPQFSVRDLERLKGSAPR